MTYSTFSQKLDGANITGVRKSSQEEIFYSVKNYNLDMFPDRLLKAYEGFQKQQIAKDLGISRSTITKLLQREQDPDAELLIKISENRKCGIGWLLGGSGEAEPGENRNPYGLAERQLLFVERLAGVRKKSFEDMMSDVVYAGLDAHALKLALSYRNMDTTELGETLDTLLANVRDDGSAEEQPRNHARRR